MTTKQTKTRKSKMLQKYKDTRKQLWPNIDDDSLWNRTHDGFTTIPRPLPQIIQIMDSLSPKGMPLALTYLSLWCRVFDASIVIIQNDRELSYEAGFTGQRAVTTWHSRMKILKDLGFIDYKGGAASDYQYVLILNPYSVIKKIKTKKKIPDHLFMPLFTRAQDIGASFELD